MPEVPELHLFKNEVNRFCSGVTFNAVDFLCPPTNKQPRFSPPFPCTISCKARGKEIKLIFKGASSTSEVVFFHGLFGGWYLVSQKMDKMEGEGGKPMLTLKGTQGEKMTFRGFSPYWRIGTWGDDRGPDPYEEFSEFRQNILQNLGSKAMQAPLYEVMLNQKIFSGVGNYLRAEVIYRAQITPFQTLDELYKNTPSDFEALLETTSSSIKEVVEGRINKYGTAEEKKRFSEWTKCYGKSTSKMLVDKSKRKFFYCPSQYEEGNKKGQNVNVGNRAAPKLAWGGSSGGGVMSGGGVISRGGVISGGGGAAFGPASFPVGYREGERERSGEEKEGFPPAVELMVLVHECFKRGLLTPEEKNVVKKTIFQDLQAPAIEKISRLRWMLFSSVQAFKAEGEFDCEEFSDSVKRVVRVLQEN